MDKGMFKKQKLDNYRRINVIMIALGLVLIGLCYMFNATKSPTDDYTVKPEHVELFDDGTIEYTFNLDNIPWKVEVFEFYSVHQFVDAYADGVLTFKLDKKLGIVGNTTSGCFNFINVPTGTKELLVRVSPCYKGMSGKIDVFQAGPGSTISRRVIVNSIPSALVSFFIIMVGIITILYWFIIRNKEDIGYTLLDLGSFSILLGLWSLNETDICTMLYSNKMAGLVISYNCLMLVGLPFMYFIRDFLDTNDRVIYKIISIINYTLFVVVNILNFLHIREYRENLMFIQLVVMITLVYPVCLIAQRVIRKQVNRKLWVATCGVAIVIVAFAVDIICYYATSGDSDEVGRFAYLLFVILLSTEVIRYTHEVMERGHRAKALERFALTDSMTSCFNRNAYEKHFEHIGEGDLQEMMYITMDLNNLKYTNDVFGHQMGDQYILDASRIFAGVFDEYGNCYRIGGDEFCCIIDNYRTIPIEKMVATVHSRLNDINVTKKYPFKMQVAIGYVKFDKELDADFKGMVQRADKLMYENKMLQKELACKIK